MKELYRFLFLGWALILLTSMVIAIPLFVILFVEGYIANKFWKAAHDECESDDGQQDGNDVARDIAGCQGGSDYIH